MKMNEPVTRHKQPAALLLQQLRRKGCRIRLDRDGRGFQVRWALNLSQFERDRLESQVDPRVDEIIAELYRERNQRRKRA